MGIVLALLVAATRGSERDERIAELEAYDRNVISILKQIEYYDDALAAKAKHKEFLKTNLKYNRFESEKALNEAFEKFDIIGAVLQRVQLWIVEEDVDKVLAHLASPVGQRRIKVIRELMKSARSSPDAKAKFEERIKLFYDECTPEELADLKKFAGSYTGDHFWRVLQLTPSYIGDAINEFYAQVAETKTKQTEDAK